MKMNYIGNEADWITDNLIAQLQTEPGSKVPIWDPKRWHGHPLLDDVRQMGTSWFGNKIPEQYFTIFNSRTPSFENYQFELPHIVPKQRRIWWWFVRLDPGELQLMHYDMHPLGVFHNDNEFGTVNRTEELINPTRYTMYLQDWEPGHVFVYGDKMNANYKKGDIYEWSAPEIFHGVVNLSFNPRYTLQITMCD
jgi:hypothetical protein